MSHLLQNKQQQREAITQNFIPFIKRELLNLLDNTRLASELSIEQLG